MVDALGVARDLAADDTGGIGVLPRPTHLSDEAVADALDLQGAGGGDSRGDRRCSRISGCAAIVGAPSGLLAARWRIVGGGSDGSMRISSSNSDSFGGSFHVDRKHDGGRPGAGTESAHLRSRARCDRPGHHHLADSERQRSCSLLLAIHSSPMLFRPMIPALRGNDRQYARCSSTSFPRRRESTVLSQLTDGQGEQSRRSKRAPPSSRSSSASFDDLPEGKRHPPSSVASWIPGARCDRLRLSLRYFVCPLIPRLALDDRHASSLEHPD